MSKTLILFNLFLMGCAQPATNQQNYIDPALQSMYDEFIQEANNSGISLNPNQGMTIKFADLETQVNPLGETVGECQGVGWGNSTILIDSGWWVKANSIGRKSVFYHECGHCILNENHVPDHRAIMNAVIDGSIEYIENTRDWTTLLNQFFSERNDNG